MKEITVNLEKAKELVAELNTAIVNDSSKDIAGKLEKAKAEIEQVNKDYKLAQFDAIKSVTEDGVNPLRYALTVKTIKRVVLKENNESGLFSIDYKDVQINLIDFSDFMGYDKEWYYKMCKLNYYYSLAVAENLTPDKADLVAKQDKVITNLKAVMEKDYKLDTNASGKFANQKSPTSIGTLQAMTQSVLDELFTAANYDAEHNVVKHHVRYVKQLCAKRAGVALVRMPSASNFSDLMFDVACLTVDKRAIELDYDKVK